VSANEKNRCVHGDYGVLHRSLEAVESKKKVGHCSNTVDYCSKSLFTTVHYLLHYSLFTVLFTIFHRFLSLKVSGFGFCYGGVRHIAADGSGVKAVV
jgi:hypothetical protein